MGLAMKGSLLAGSCAAFSPPLPDIKDYHCQGELHLADIATKEAILPAFGTAPSCIYLHS